MKPSSTEAAASHTKLVDEEWKIHLDCILSGEEVGVQGTVVPSGCADRGQGSCLLLIPISSELCSPLPADSNCQTAFFPFTFK